MRTGLTVQARAYEQLEALESEHWWFRGRRHVCMQLLSDALQEPTLERALDLGAGTGGFLPELQRVAQHVNFTDVDMGVLETCGRKGFVAGVRALGDALPFESERFDLVCLFDVVEHIEDDLAALREVERVLRPGGSVFVHVPAFPLLYARNDEISGHYRRYTRRSLRSVMERAGFDVVRNTHTNVGLFPLIAPAVLGLKAVERLRASAPTYTNLSWSPPRWLQSLFYGVFRAELALSRHIDLPLGHSIAAIARKASLK